MDASLPRLTAQQAAARLGVKPQTLYAYVSRGLLSRERDAHGSTFDALEIESFASTRRSPGSSGETFGGTAGTAPSGTPLMVLDTDIALIEDDELYFRGVAVEELVIRHPYEAVARWLWGTSVEPSREPIRDAPSGARLGSLSVQEFSASPFSFDADAVATARAALAVLSPAATPLDRIQVAVPILGAADATRHDLAPDAVRSAAERLIGGVVAALAPAVGRTASPRPLAATLWTVFSARTPVAAELTALGAALVLLVDHDLAVSTLAARAAASARATPYAVVSSGLGALDSALHGNASGAASELIRMVLDGADARTAIAQTVARTGRPAPGFGQPLYTETDARARILLPLIAELPDGARVIDAVDRLATEIEAHTGRYPNVDLALAALTTATGMPPDAGAAIFAVARMAGWIAHALDEYERRPLRVRPRGRYVGRDAGVSA